MQFSCEQSLRPTGAHRLNAGNPTSCDRNGLCDKEFLEIQMASNRSRQGFDIHATPESSSALVHPQSILPIKDMLQAKTRRQLFQTVPSPSQTALNAAETEISDRPSPNIGCASTRCTYPSAIPEAPIDASHSRAGDIRPRKRRTLRGYASQCAGALSVLTLALPCGRKLWQSQRQHTSCDRHKGMYVVRTAM